MSVLLLSPAMRTCSTNSSSKSNVLWVMDNIHHAVALMLLVLLVLVALVGSC